MALDGMKPASQGFVGDGDTETAYVREAGEGVLDATEVIDHGATAKQNLKGAWEMLWRGALPDKTWMALTNPKEVNGPNTPYLEGLFLAAAFDFAADPLLSGYCFIKDGLEAAWHGILSGFQDSSRLTSRSEQERATSDALAPLTEQITGIPKSASGSGPVGSEDQAKMRVAELLTGNAPQNADDHPFELSVTELASGYQVKVAMKADRGARLELGAFDVNQTSGDVTRTEAPRFPRAFLSQAAKDIRAEYESRRGQPGVPDLGDKGDTIFSDPKTSGRLDFTGEEGKWFHNEIRVFVDNGSEAAFIQDMIQNTPSLRKYACLDFRFL